MTVSNTPTFITRLQVPPNNIGLKSFFYGLNVATGDGSGGSVSGGIKFAASQQEYFVVDKILPTTNNSAGATWYIRTYYNWDFYDTSYFGSAGGCPLLVLGQGANGTFSAANNSLTHPMPWILGTSNYGGSGLYFSSDVNTNTCKYALYVQGRIFNQFPYDLILNKI